MGTTQLLGGFGRTIAVATASAGLVAGALVAAPGARAAPAGPVGDVAPRTQADAEDLAEGFASGRASVVSIAPATGNLAFAFTIGISGTETAGNLAQGLAHPLDLGLIGTALTGESCTGGDPAVEPDQLPQAVRADNRSGDADVEETFFPIVGSDLGAGVSRVTATMQPASQATTKSSRVALPPVLVVEGGEAVTTSEILDDGTRVARSTVELDISIADAIRLEGLQWTAEHRSGGGRETSATGSFEGGTLRLLGEPLPLQGPAPSIAEVNTILNLLGFHLDLPEVERIEDPVDLVRVTPLRLRVADNPLGDLAVKPALDLTRAMRSDLFDAVEEAYCAGSGLLLVGEIFLGSVSGTGSLIAELGGVEARSGEVLYEDLFAFEPRAAAPPAEPSIAEAPVEPARPEPAAAEPPAPAAPAAPAPIELDEAPVGAAPEMVLTGASERCESTHGFGWPPCSTGAALPVGVGGALATAGVAALDLRRRTAALTPAGRS